MAYFPYVEVPGAPGPKDHPVIVLATSLEDVVALFCCYGSSSEKSLELAKTWDLVIDQDEAKEVGLSRRTRFQLDRCAWLDYDDTWFKRALGSPNPIVGPLPKATLTRLRRGRDEWERVRKRPLIPPYDSTKP